MSEFNEMLNQAFGESETPSEETTDTTIEEVGTDKTEQVDAKTEQDGEQEVDTKEQTEEPQKFVLKNKIIGDKEVTLEELLVYGQKGTDYERIIEKEQKRNELVKRFYPELKTIDNLLKAIRQNEMDLAKKDYLEKGYDEKDIERLIQSDERFKEIDKKLDETFETEKVTKELEEDVKTINEQFGTDLKSYNDLDNAVKQKASDHDISLVDAYYLVNKDKIIADAKSKAKKSLVADIKDKKSKDLPKGGSPSEDVFITDLDKKLGSVFGFDRSELSQIAKNRKK